jgi:hypothetical protein
MIRRCQWNDERGNSDAEQNLVMNRPDKSSGALLYKPAIETKRKISDLLRSDLSGAIAMRPEEHVAMLTPKIL